ncbi:hypothetical protein BC939DRAFT_87038 [Gamsiella multidivaricata]|uniref:uncharacterized protein n=1 Tax=Gamsiella multidivaricata TaxID=101098 RepID=UPI00221F0157|nr:uncharacterized protein BC939DRAFT_87038 [Gamsiella multidivaricata]KAG0359574.1 hypothetical protein BGZ54_009903 [Gamsiella multidivaricata]KAI7827683.1 hypothetical protein BC939DRAFT_87038 [Gamsiella multidivaricata]
MLDDDVSAFAKRDKIPQARNDLQMHIPRTRRATGESMSRPNSSKSKATTGTATEANFSTSAPRPIPKSNNSKKNLQSSAMSSSYTFDESIDNPFLPSTPPMFTPSMERSGFFKPNSSEEGTVPASTADKPISSKERTARARMASQQTSSKEITTSAPTPKSSTQPPATHNEATPNTHIPKFENPFSITTRSRNGSLSGIPGLPGPRHEDMILPAVARRIKEQGLFDHDVIAYSDDYNAPLYKLPTSPATQGNPFASYDRAKAASSTSLGHPLSQSESLSPAKESGSMETELPPSPPVPDVYDSRPRKQPETEADQTVPEARSTKQSRQQAEPETQSRLTEPKNDVTRPERPRRTRRDTNHQTQQENAVSAEDHRTRRTPRPMMPESDQHSQGSNQSSPTHYQDQNGMKQGSNQSSSSHYQDQYDGENGWNDAYSRQQQQQQQQSYRSDARDRRYQNNEYGRQEQSNVNDGSYQKQQHGSPQMGDRYEGRRQKQTQGDYPQNDGYNRTRRQEGHEYHQDSYNGRQGGYNSQPIGYHTQNGDYNGQQGRYDTQQDHYNGQQSGYNGQQNGYDAQYGNHDARYGDNNNYSRGASAPGHDKANVQRLQQRPDMAQMEMLEVNAGSREGGAADEVAKIDPKDMEQMKKKGSVCCTIM